MNFLLGLVTLISSARGDEIDHLRVARWKEMTPQVVICDGLDIETELVERAIQYWRDRGEKIGSVRRKPCGQDPLKGEIALYEGNHLPSDTAGTATRFTRDEKTPPKIEEITRSRICIKEKFNFSVLLIQHELGHALGFIDTEESGSIMSIRGNI